MCIDLTVGEYTTNKAKKTSNWIPGIHLTTYYKQVLLDPVGWITDTIINAAQKF